MDSGETESIDDGSDIRESRLSLITPVIIIFSPISILSVAVIFVVFGAFGASCHGGEEGNQLPDRIEVEV